MPQAPSLRPKRLSADDAVLDSFCQTQFRFVIGAAEGYPTAGAADRRGRAKTRNWLIACSISAGPPGSASSAIIFPRRLPGDAKQAIDWRRVEQSLSGHQRGQ
jgi:hypothetical protein